MASKSKKNNGAVEGVQAQPAAQPEAQPPPMAGDLAPLVGAPCRCGGKMNLGTLPDGRPAMARMLLLPSDTPPGVTTLGGPTLDSGLLICPACKRVELVWSGR